MHKVAQSGLLLRDGETPTVTPPARRPQLWLADHARRNHRRVSAGGMGCHEGAFLLPPGVANSLKAILRLVESLGSYLG